MRHVDLLRSRRPTAGTDPDPRARTGAAEQPQSVTVELVLLQDVYSSYAANWARVANTSGIDRIQVGDRFREQGVGPGGEELEVAGISLSPVGGVSKIFFNRCANVTQPSLHRLGAVLEMVTVRFAVAPQMALVNASAATAHVFDVPVHNKKVKKVTDAERLLIESMAMQNRSLTVAEEIVEELVPAYRGRGRPRGSKNKTKTARTAAAEAFGLG